MATMIDGESYVGCEFGRCPTKQVTSACVAPCGA